MIVTLDTGVRLVVRCTQYASAVVLPMRCSRTIVWFAPSVRAVPLLVSLPTPNTQELLRVVVTVADGKPDVEFVPVIAPMAPDPFVPEGSAFLKLKTWINPVREADKVAVTATLLSVDVANARWISAVPPEVFVRRTRTQVRPPPVTVVVVAVVLVVATNASKSSFGAAVENEGVTNVLEAVL